MTSFLVTRFFVFCDRFEWEVPIKIIFKVKRKCVRFESGKLFTKTSVHMIYLITKDKLAQVPIYLITCAQFMTLKIGKDTLYIN